MKTLTKAALASAVILATPQLAVAGNMIEPTDDRVVIVTPAEMTEAGSLGGSLGGGATAGLIGLLLIGAALAGGGS